MYPSFGDISQTLDKSVLTSNLRMAVWTHLALLIGDYRTQQCQDSTISHRGHNYSHELSKVYREIQYMHIFCIRVGEMPFPFEATHIMTMT